MKRFRLIIFAVYVVVFVPGSVCFADTFTNPATGEVLHGYATSKSNGGLTIVNTQEKDVTKLNLAEWDIVANRLGRKNKIIVVTINGPIMHEIETAALEESLGKLADQGPLFILLKIDTPGGRTDLAQRICGAITAVENCEVVAFINGGKYGGAISAGAAVAFACDKIYMSSNSVIGAATMIAMSEKGPEELKKVYGKTIGEKYSSMWRAYLASLAEQNHRPGLLARAMVDKDIEVIEVAEADKRFFIDPINKRSQQNLVHTWSKKGSLLTLTAAEAARCGIGDKVVSSQNDLLRAFDAGDAKIIANDAIQKAEKELRRAKRQLNRIRKSVDLKIKQSKHPQPRAKVLKILRTAKNEFQRLIKLAKRYPDLQLNVQQLEDELNTIKANYENAKRKSKRR